MPSPRPSVTAVLAVLALAAVLSAGWFGWSWWAAAHDPTVIAAAQRDAALRDARQIAINLSTVRQDSIEADLRRWEDSATGPMLDEFRKRHDEMVRTFQQAKISNVGVVKDAALTEFDPAGGRAKAIVAVDVTGTPAGGTPSTRRQLDQIELQRTEDAWKATAAGPVTGRPGGGG